MAIKFEKIQPGMELWDYQSRKQGNTTSRRIDRFRVLVLEVDEAGRRVRASWNSNPAKWYSKRSAAKWYVNPPKAYRVQQNREAAHRAFMARAKGEG